MRGRVLDFDVQTNSGIISGDDGFRYSFTGSEWYAEGLPTRGTTVDFETQDTDAISIYQALDSYGGTTTRTVTTPKSKITAGVLAILLGYFGVHKFYLGYAGAGLVFLLVNTIGMFVTVFLGMLPNFALGIIAFIEGIIYLTKTDEEFEQMYVINRKPWF